MHYVRENWYWIVDGDTSEVYSSASDSTVSITDATYVAWLGMGGVPTNIDHDDMTKIRIDIIEETITTRRTREAILGTDGGWLTATEAKIEALRATL